MASYKLRRRRTKYTQMLQRDFSIDTSLEPTKIVMICNAGLVSGVKYEEVAKLFTQFGQLENIVMVPKKSYCFVVYSSVYAATDAHNGVNGKEKLANMDSPIYLLYSTSVPPEFDLPESHPLPEGLVLLGDFVTEDEEERLLSSIGWDTESREETGKTLKHRRVKHFGYEFRYDTNNVDKDSPLEEAIPLECGFIGQRVAELGHPLAWTPDQLTVNQYQRGQGIPSHVDTHSAFESPILSLSLGSDAVMEFRRGQRHVPVLLPRRSLLLMDGECRYAWSHGITPRTMDVVAVAGGLSVRERACRTSFTLRKVRQGSCRCSYVDCCDSQQTHIPDHEASRLEDLYVHKVYNSIASHFSETRTKQWPNVTEFLRSFPAGSVIIDAGCGNGKYFGVNPLVFQMGFDRSEGLAGITQSRGHEVFVGDCMQLPVREAVADGIISVAVLHHLSTQSRRLCAVREMARVLVPGGRALITVWARSQTKQDLSAYLKQDRKNRRRDMNSWLQNVSKNVLSEIPVQSEKSNQELPQCNLNSNILKDDVHRTDTSNMTCEPSDFKLPVHTARTEFQHPDVFVPWKVKSKETNHQTKEVFLRYYHVFEESELKELCSSLKEIKILQTYYTEGNWCIIFEKVKS